jgi:hypothetical protein
MGVAQAEKPMLGKDGMGCVILDPRFGAVSSRSGQMRGSLHDHSWCGNESLMGRSGACSPHGQCRRVRSAGRGHRVSIFLHPLAPPALPGFIATTGAPTPARPTDLLASRACPGEGRGLPASCNRPSEPSVSNHRPAPMAALAPNPSAPSASLACATVWASPLGRRLARRYGRIEFLIVRMARSLPVAPHPASRRRSYIQLQAGVGIPGEDLHLPDQWHSQAHDPRFRGGDE